MSFDPLGHLTVHPLQAVHRQLQPEPALERRRYLAERRLHTQPLGPVLQHIRVGARWQLQAVVQRNELNLLPFAAAVHRP